MSEDEESIASPAYGAALAATLELREKTFPKKTSWAYAPLKTKPDDCRTLAQLTVDGPSPHANGSSYDSAVRLSTCDGPLAQQFITLNTQLARGRSDARLFTRTEKLKILARQDAAGLILMVKMRKLDGSFTSPVLLHTGPIATFPKGEVYGVDEYESAPEGLKPSSTAMPNDEWPEALAPLFLSVGAQSRKIFESKGRADKVRQKFLQDIPLLVIPDARDTMSYVQVRLRDGTLLNALDSDSPPIKAKLWAPDNVTTDAKGNAAFSTALGWLLPKR